MCVALIAGLFLAVVTAAWFFYARASVAPLSFLSIFNPSLSFLFLEKRIMGVVLNFYTFSPRTLQIPGQLPLITPLQISFCLSSPLSPSLSRGMRGIIA